MTEQKPTVGRVVHYVSYGTPGGEYASECRAAIVTEVHATDRNCVSLAVFNPTGMFFNTGVLRHDGDVGYDHAGHELAAPSYRGGTWHWPERV